MIEKNKNYNIKELKELFGDEWQDKIGIIKPPPISPKPFINSFDDFDEKTKQIYTNIYNLIKEKNQSKDINVWATGSRVKGKWKTPQEAEAILINYPNAKVKYSDYDFCTDAQNYPTKQQFYKQLGVAIDHAGCEGHKVLIKF